LLVNECPEMPLVPSVLALPDFKFLIRPREYPQVGLFIDNLPLLYALSIQLEVYALRSRVLLLVVLELESKQWQPIILVLVEQP